MRIDADGAAALAALKAMNYGIFDDRLDGQTGNLHRERILINVRFKMNPIAVAQLLNADIAVQICDLLAERNRRFQSPQIIAQHTGYGDNQRIGFCGILKHRRLRDAVQGVEQEMRIDLRLQRLQLCVAEHILRIQVFQLTVAQLVFQIGLFVQPRDIAANLLGHFIEGSGKVADLVVRGNIDLMLVLRILRNDGRLLRQQGERLGKIS